MSWRMKVAVIVPLALLLAGCVWLGYVVHAKYQGNAYVLRMGASFNAAAMVNGDETYTEPDRAVISAWGEKRYVIVPENYRALMALLRKDAAMPAFRRVRRDAPLTIAICDSAFLRIQPDEGSADGALIAFTDDGGHRFTMHVRGGNIWRQIVEYATTGHGEHPNLEL